MVGLSCNYTMNVARVLYLIIRPFSGTAKRGLLIAFTIVLEGG